MSDRETIFNAIREALSPVQDPTPYPEYDLQLSESHFARSDLESVQLFRQQLEAAKGVYLDSWDALGAFLREKGVQCGYADPSLADAPTVLPEMQLEGTIDRERIDAYEFGITTANGAIAESGTIIIGDTDSKYRLAALAPWIHIAVVQKADIVRTVNEAVALFGEDPSIIFVTGPSKTADIEGILIEGVHGPGVQACLVV